MISINEVDGSGTPTNAVLASTTVPDASVPPGVSTMSSNTQKVRVQKKKAAQEA